MSRRTLSQAWPCSYGELCHTFCVFPRYEVAQLTQWPFKTFSSNTGGEICPALTGDSNNPIWKGCQCQLKRKFDMGCHFI